MDRLRWIGWVGTALVLTLTLLRGGPLSSDVNVPALLLVLVGTPLVWFMTAGSGVATLSAVLRGQDESAAAVERALLALRTLRRAAWQVGGLGATLALLPVLWTVSTDPQPFVVLGTTVACVLYVGLTDLLVLQPTLYRLEQRRAELRAAPGLDADHRVRLDAALDRLQALRKQQEARDVGPR